VIIVVVCECRFAVVIFLIVFSSMKMATNSETVSRRSQVLYLCDNVEKLRDKFTTTFSSYCQLDCI